MEENKIIEANYREVSGGGECELNRLTTEIRFITVQLNKTLLTGIIEIGKRFDRAKSLVKHGEWGGYVEDCTGYSQSMAENYIKIYKEYGSEQQSIFGDMSNSQSLGNLGITKLLELTVLPPDERESFVEENNVTEDTTVKELQELIKKKTAAAEDAEMQFRIKEEELNSAIRRNNDVITEKQDEIDRLKKELGEMKNAAPAAADSDEMSAMIAEAEERVKADLQKSIDNLEKEKKKVAAEAEKKQKQYDKLLKEKSEQEIKNSKLEEQINAAEKEKAEMKETIARLQKESLLGSNENLVTLNLLFENAQRDISQIKDTLNKIKGTEQYEKLKDAISKTLTAAAEF